MNDLDYLKMNRDFTDNPGHYDVAQGQAFLDRLHAAGQHYLPILDPNIYVPNPSNASDAYPTYDRGSALNAYLHDGTDEEYIGVEWPGFSVFPDFLVPQAHQFWTDEIKRFHETLAFDGFWLDVSDPVSYCSGSSSRIPCMCLFRSQAIRTRCLPSIIATLRASRSRTLQKPNQPVAR